MSVPQLRTSALSLALRAAGEALRPAGEVIRSLCDASSVVLVELAEYLLLRATDPLADGQDVLLTVRQAANMTGAGQRRIRDAVNKGELKGIRAGKELRVWQRDAVAWANRHLVQPAHPSAQPAPAIRSSYDARSAVNSRLGIRPGAVQPGEGTR